MNKIRLRYITLCILMLSAIAPARGLSSVSSNIVSCQVPGGGIVDPIQLEDEITTFDYCGRSALRDAFEATWRKKELDKMHGLDLYDSSARYYDHVLGRFHQVDPLAEKYYAWSPYAYCMGNPINKIDLYGDSAVVLIDHSGAFFLGHMAILIQKESGQWEYYSKNGRDKKTDLGGQKFSSPAVFLKSHNYDEGFVIPMTTDEDNKAREGMLDALNEQYSTFLSNCGQSVQAALRNTGKKDGSKVMKDTQNTHSGIVDSPQLNDALNIIPNVLFMNIKLQNEGYEIYK